MKRALNPDNRLRSLIVVALIVTTAPLCAQESAAQPISADTNAVKSLPDVVVKGEETPAGGNVVDDTTLKLPTTLHETPRSVSVVDAERIREQNFRTPVDT